MPTYEYLCTRCGERLEAVQSFSDAPLTDCPSCGKKKALRKLFSAVGVVFKGSGFYKTDSRSTGKSTAAGTEPAAKSSSSDSKADSSASKSDSGASSSTTSSSTTSASTTSAKDGGSKVA